MRILGIDPGYATIGYGLINSVNHQTIHSLGYGVITTKANDKFITRLESIYDDMSALLRESRPDALSIEKLYFQNNQKTAIDVAQARGVILLAIQKSAIPIYEYTPLQIKMSITGYGKAEKYQIMEMTRKLLHLQCTPKPDDAADALAMAICHYKHAGMHTITNKINTHYNPQPMKGRPT